MNPEENMAPVNTVSEKNRREGWFILLTMESVIITAEIVRG